MVDHQQGEINEAEQRSAIERQGVTLYKTQSGMHF